MAKFQGHLAVIQLVCSRASKTSDTTRKLHHNCKCPIFTSKGTDTSLLIWKLNLKTGYTKNWNTVIMLTIKCFQKSFFLKKMFYSVIYITHVNSTSNTFYAIEKTTKQS